MTRSIEPARVITVVSGLPRSGTSMMMQMLAAAGLELAIDEGRAPDIDNPRGYLELTAVKSLRRDASFLAGAVGKGVKIVAPLLPHLPDDYTYRVVFMERDLDEILRSQATMLDRVRTKGERPDDAAMKRAFARSLDEVKAWLGGQPNVSTLRVSHREALRAPERTAERVADFLFSPKSDLRGAGDGRCLVERCRDMARVVDPSLHRSRR